jgi:hypothetical protein
MGLKKPEERSVTGDFSIEFFSSAQKDEEYPERATQSKRNIERHAPGPGAWPRGYEMQSIQNDSENKNTYENS